MKKVLRRLFPALCLAALPVAASADTTVDSTTLLRFYQDSRTGLQSKTFVPATQFLAVDADKLADGNLSLHLYGWGRLDLGERTVTPGQGDSSLDGRLSYGFLKYRFGAANAQARAGRFSIQEGIISEQIDGVSVRTDLPYGFGVSAFGGANVHTTDIEGEKTDGKGDGIFGGRVNYRYGGLVEVGLSGVYESKAPTLTQHNLGARFGDHRLVGTDFYLAPHRMVQLSGRASYNTETEGFAEQGYLLQVRPLKELTLAGEYNQYNDRDMFYGSALFAGMPSMLNGNNLNELSRSLGGSASYQLDAKTEITLDAKHYSRDLGKADRVGGLVRYTLPEAALRAGLGYHYLRSSSDFAVIPSSTASGSFHELRAYAMRDTKSYFCSLDMIDYVFKKDIAGKSQAFELAGSLGYHLSPNLAFSGDLSYGSNPLYDDEVKGLLRLTYTAKFTGKGDQK
jgi:hypothetical protein